MRFCENKICINHVVMNNPASDKLIVRTGWTKHKEYHRHLLFNPKKDYGVYLCDICRRAVQMAGLLNE